jgi:hypothetical protein
MSELPTVLLYSFVAIAASLMLWQWHRSDRFKGFSLVDLVAEDGKLSSRKFMEFGAWVAATIAFVVMTIRGTITEAWLVAYTGVFVLGRLGGQVTHTMSETTTRKAEIMRGRRGDLFTSDPDDSDTVEGQERDEREGQLTRRSRAGEDRGR